MPLRWYRARLARVRAQAAQAEVLKLIEPAGFGWMEAATSTQAAGFRPRW